MPPRHTLGQRIKAAMDLGGFESLDDLAAAVNLPNLSGKSLRRTANSQREPGTHELVGIAEACGLSPAFFSLDLGRLSDADEPAGVTQDELRTLVDVTRTNSGRITNIEETLRPIREMTDELRELRESLRDHGLRLAALELADQQRTAEAPAPGRAAR